MICSSSNSRATLVQNGCIVEYEFATVLKSVRVVKGDKEVIDIENKHFSRNKENGVAIQIPGNDDEACDVVEIDREHFYKKKRTRDAAAGGDVLKRAVVQIDNKQFSRLMGTSRSEHAGEIRNKVVDLVKSKEKMDDDDDDLRIMKRVTQVLGNELVVHAAVKKEHEHNEGGMYSQTRTRKCARCSIEFEIDDEKHLEGGEGGGDIADKGGVRRSRSVRLPPPTFREEVLTILRLPFDKEEYRKHKKTIKVGSYLHHHPDVKRKLKTYRHKRGKRLVILRGFFYWLENLTREGAFQPWTDRQCLAVDPPSS